MTIIAFIGSVFSPYYALARRRGLADAANHCAMNVALYGDTSRWAMTERGAGALEAGPDQLQIGPSGMRVAGGELVVDFTEICVPLPRQLRGRVRIALGGRTGRRFMLNRQGRHCWSPLAVASRIEVEIDEPRLNWRGHAYVDANRGDAPIADGFRRWHWARAATADGAAILYGGEHRGGGRFGLGLSVSAGGDVAPWPLPPEARLPTSHWGIARAVPSETPPRLLRTLLDAPFYARSLVEIGHDGARVEAMHESLDLDRLRNPLVLAMLPFKMPRRGRWPG